MAFSSAAFTRIGGSGAHQLFIYYTADVLTGTAGVDVTESGYFDDVIDDLNLHDVILAVCDTGGTPVLVVLIVTSVTTHVTVSTNVTQT
jgi:uncharacterized membrane protein YdbT with pleckstrin-like domain